MSNHPLFNSWEKVIDTGKPVDLTGQRFGMLTVLEYYGVKTLPNGDKRTAWHCLCDCGNKIIVTTHDLRSGNTHSCGCYAKKRQSECNKTHGETKTRLHTHWLAMKGRCYNPNNNAYCNYGARGITVCDEWLNSYLSFRDWALNNGYSEALPSSECTLDRIDVNGNYCPENCRWVSMKEQCNNKRDNYYISYNGTTKTLTQWAEEYGIRCRTLRTRIVNLNWPVDKALNTPVKPHKRYKLKEKENNGIYEKRLEGSEQD